MSVGGLFDRTDHCIRVLRQRIYNAHGSDLQYLDVASIEGGYQIYLKRCLDRGLDEQRLAVYRRILTAGNEAHLEERHSSSYLAQRQPTQLSHEILEALTDTPRLLGLFPIYAGRTRKALRSLYGPHSSSIYGRLSLTPPKVKRELTTESYNANIHDF